MRKGWKRSRKSRLDTMDSVFPVSRQNNTILKWDPWVGMCVVPVSKKTENILTAILTAAEFQTSMFIITQETRIYLRISVSFTFDFFLIKHLILHVRDGGYCFAQSLGASFLIRLGNSDHISRGRGQLMLEVLAHLELFKNLLQIFCCSLNMLLQTFSLFFQKRLLKGDMSLKFNVKVSKWTATHVICFCPTSWRRFRTKCPPKENWKHPSWGFFFAEFTLRPLMFSSITPHF